MLYLNDCKKEFKTDLRSDPGNKAGSKLCELIWGDALHPTGRERKGFIEVSARGQRQPGWVRKSFTTNKHLLEIYVIDVGQGDGVLIRTPDDKWHLIDAGIANDRQMTGKGAANFIRWKFRQDLKQPAHLSTITMSHPDFDHYGGLLNLLSGDLGDGDAPFQVSVDAFYHSGMGRFDSSNKLGATHRGKVSGFPIRGFGIRKADSFIVELLDDKNSFEKPDHDFAGRFEDLAALVVDKVRAAKRLGVLDGKETWFPRYAPEDKVKDGSGNRLSIKILAPIVETFFDKDGNKHVGLRNLASESKTRNGHSITLRIDYGKARILMTGDLNEESQRLLLSYIDPGEFEADVAKGCHHGSEDIDMRFLKAMKGRATVISSGDNEDYAHPRPVVMGASAFYGREIVTTEDEALPPLLYSTELARSTKLSAVEHVSVDHDNNPSTRQRSYPSDRAKVRPKGNRYRNFSNTPVATNLVYGLVNVRTDGKRILCATMEEKGSDFNIKTFWAGRAPKTSASRTAAACGPPSGRGAR